MAVGVGPEVGVGSNCGGEVHWWGMGSKYRKVPKSGIAGHCKAI